MWAETSQGKVHKNRRKGHSQVCFVPRPILESYDVVSESSIRFVLTPRKISREQLAASMPADRPQGVFYPTIHSTFHADSTGQMIADNEVLRGDKTM